MKIVIEYTNQCPFLTAISKALSQNSNEVILWQPDHNNIYEMVHQVKPEFLIISDKKDTKHWELIQNIPYIIYGPTDSGGKSLAKLPIFNKESKGFVDLLTYREGFSDYLYNTDILVSSNFFNGNTEVLILMDKIFSNTDYTLKCSGNTVLPTPFFIGTSENESFMSIAKASKIVVASNQIEKLSLLYNKIYACTVEEFTDETYKMITEDKLRSKYIKQQRKEITDKNRFSTAVVDKILKIINKPQTTGQLL